MAKQLQLMYQAQQFSLAKHNPFAPIDPEAEWQALSDAGVQTDTIIGFRVWRVSTSSIKLRSVFAEVDWPFATPLRASEQHLRADKGIHAFRNEIDAVQYMHSLHTSCILGRVQLWGQTIEHEKGWRAEYAKILSLKAGGSAYWRALCELYGLSTEESPAINPAGWTGRPGSCPRMITFDVAGDAI